MAYYSRSCQTRAKDVANLTLQVGKAADAGVFWILHDHLVRAECEYANDRTFLLDRFQKGHLFFLKAASAQDDCNAAGIDLDELVLLLGCRKGMMYLPALAIVDEEKTCLMMWVRQDVRECGLGSSFVRQLGVLHTARGRNGAGWFWKHHGINRKPHPTSQQEKRQAVACSDESEDEAEARAIVVPTDTVSAHQDETHSDSEEGGAIGKVEVAVSPSDDSAACQQKKRRLETGSESKSAGRKQGAAESYVALSRGRGRARGVSARGGGKGSSFRHPRNPVREIGSHTLPKTILTSREREGYYSAARRESDACRGPPPRRYERAEFDHPEWEDYNGRGYVGVAPRSRNEERDYHFRGYYPSWGMR